MSNKIARQRAEAGMIFRDGHLVNKDKWYKAHPTPEMKRQKQSEVDKAVQEMIQQKRMGDQGIIIVRDGKVLDPKDTSAILAEAEPYYCSKCKITHRTGKIHQEHHNFASKINVI
jgi:hypothetical protein